MLGHADGLVDGGVAGVRSRRWRRPTKWSCRSRSTARCARASDRAGRGCRTTSCGAGAGGSRRAGAHGGEDDPQGGRREGPLGQCGGVMTRGSRHGRALRSCPCCRGLVLLLVLAIDAGLRLRAGRPRVVSAGLHPDDRRADVREPHAGLQPRDAADAEGARRVHRPRQVSDPARQRPGVDALLIGEVTGVSDRAGELRRQQLASRYTLTMTARVELRGRAREQGALGELRASSSARSTRPTERHRAPPTRRRSSARTPTRSIA